ncbi:MAG: hypothetical protein EAZ60_24050 [Oscillatoriales cyanobacterium]|nr:MAG: hypothetical protein EAZ83_18225 [Oscillatoriales cyanobacterium]TAE92401.1 MAG: hypothetical protein EAZ79_29890 [Oscillatoriales cyanobacterium]TAF17848.1 MAG: hypothetical protein EAZ73_19740 [Oscillatoriales cyanobacterium]TAF26685.1 MAG: hypothetical protein EAZ69_28830 [Oscillatoriales cyanobacterium]TAF52218.1 MAG: hypothetical protein EAZ60_24050 [Oscillatoriales cyanobacterium]
MLFFIITQELCFGMCGKTYPIQQRAAADLHGPGAFVTSAVRSTKAQIQDLCNRPLAKVLLIKFSDGPRGPIPQEKKIFVGWALLARPSYFCNLV